MAAAARLCVLALVLLAGCGGTVAPPTETPTPTAAVPAPTGTPTATPTPSPTPDPTPSPTPALGSPFGSERVQIAYTVVSNPDNQSFDRAFRRAVSYWNNAGQEYATYPVRFSKVDEVADADVVIYYGASADNCGGIDDENAVGCAPVLDRGDSVTSQQRVHVEAGYTVDATTNTTMHELGHVLGLRHGDAPMPLMNASSVIPEVSQPDAVNKTNPWGRTALTYYVSNDLSAGQRTQIEAAFRYFQNGADGATDVQWVFMEVPRRSNASIVITEADPDDWRCPSDYYSCGGAWGISPDADPALEEYTWYDIQLSDQISDDATAWWTAVWLFYATNPGEDIPSEFLDLDYEERRSGWWAG